MYSTHVVNGSAGIIGNSLNMNLALTDLADQMAAMGTGELLGLYMESAVLSLAMKAISLCIFIIIYGRMIEIYLVCSIAPIPFSTMANRDG
ncbi:MAG: CD0415/CD1112 family protein [Oscillospiraceae bacterium]|nr:CD0415/CD1112 family protein [Oscillospiraceae bacterium]